MFTIICLGVVFGVFFSFDLFFSAKRKGTFIRQLVVLITTSIPAIYTATIGNDSGNNSIQILWFNFFYPTLLVTLLSSFIVIFLFVYNPLMRKIERNKSDRLFTFFDFLYKGYYSFQSDLEATFKEANVNTDKNEESLIKIHQNLREDIIEFINEIYETIDDADIDGYIGYVLFGFVQKFLSECDARFTLRRLDSSQNKMVAIFSTREDIHPGDIDLRKKNLISLSLNLNKPVIYSENMKNHYKTSNNSIHKGKYEDYVSFCLLKTVDNKPFYSICLDVKGENAKKRMKAFVDSLVFDVICSAIALKFIKSAQDEKLEEN